MGLSFTFSSSTYSQSEELDELSLLEDEELLEDDALLSDELLLLFPRKFNKTSSV